MPSKKSKRLVVDASVARAAGGEEATHATSQTCREFLLTILKVCHRVVMTAEIRKEWDKHQSRFARGWRVSMVARKKLVLLTVEANPTLRNKLERVAGDGHQSLAIMKDCHLIEAALETDHTIISLDDTARGLFSEASAQVHECRPIIWVNPSKPEDDSLVWLNGGARPERVRLLGFVASKA